jgi:hypothetical protein
VLIGYQHTDETNHKETDYMDKLRLFAIRRRAYGPLVTTDTGEPIYFDNKMDAKVVRNRITEGANLTVNMVGRDKHKAVVTKAPDHRLYQETK